MQFENLVAHCKQWNPKSLFLPKVWTLNDAGILSGEAYDKRIRFGRDENIHKNWRWQRRQLTSKVDRLPLVKLSLVDVNHEKLSLVNVDQGEKHEKCIFGTKLLVKSLIDVDQWKSSVWSTSTVDHQPLTSGCAFHHALRFCNLLSL